jgi:hypothetical protein
LKRMQAILQQNALIGINLFFGNSNIAWVKTSTGISPANAEVYNARRREFLYEQGPGVRGIRFPHAGHPENNVLTLHLPSEKNRVAGEGPPSHFKCGPKKYALEKRRGYYPDICFFPGSQKTPFPFYFNVLILPQALQKKDFLC